MTKERQLEIIQHNIDFYDEKYNNFIKFGISIKKIDRVEALRDGFIASKAIVEAT